MLENKDKFAINLVLPDILGIYNSNIHSITKFAPKTIFYIDDNDVIKKDFENTKKSQKKFKKLYSPFKINTKCLLAENFVLKNNYIKAKPLIKKDKYSVPCIIVGYSGDNDYKIKLSVNYKNLNIDNEYIVDYHLIIECQEIVWNKIRKFLDS